MRAIFGFAMSFALGCAPAKRTEPQAPAAPPVVAQPPPREPVKTPTDPDVPDWVKKELQQMKLVSADNAGDLVGGVHVVVSPTRVVLEGEEVARVDAMVTAGKIQRVDLLFEKLKRLRENYKSEHPDQPFPGVVNYWIDGRVSALVVKSVFQTCAFAGYPNGNFGVRRRSGEK